jgi:cytidylate kinase
LGRRHIITIDGPAGAGKSTLGRRLAQSLGYRYLDSGSLYRAVAWQARRLQADPGDSLAMAGLLPRFQPHFTSDAQGFHVSLDGCEISRELRTPEVSQAASRVAAIPEVRRWVGDILRDLAREGGVVAEGRDLGSVVFPDALVKFYLDADLAARAVRRQHEWQEGGEAATLAGTLNDIATRDSQDQNRATAPLTVPEGAYYLDTTGLNPDEVVEQCLARIRSTLGAGRAGTE